MKLAELLEAYIKQKGIGYRKLAKEIDPEGGVSHSALHKFVKGKHKLEGNLSAVLRWVLSEKGDE